MYLDTLHIIPDLDNRVNSLIEKTRFILSINRGFSSMYPSRVHTTGLVSDVISHFHW